LRPALAGRFGLTLKETDAVVTLELEPSLHIGSSGSTLILRAPVFWTADMRPKVQSIRTDGGTFVETGVQVLGSLRYPNTVWTTIQKGVEIKGGGLRFEPAGVSFLPRTEVRRVQ
jgi:hypothetical protein